MTGTTLTHYRITAKLGEGGMGEVYRAKDTKLEREVAIKVLPASFSRRAQSLARFEREAKALAALNHPHIASIYGFDADRQTHFLVLELVEGDTLNQRLRRGPLPVDEALRVARQIAEALEAAHAKGIIHRDLKPGNIKLTADRRVKVLDFGLAKMEESVRAGEAEPSDSEAPTLLAETTMPGAILGTPAYMSPEQARGQEVDKRTDVWAFGCCLFECLAGSKPFAGQTVTDMMAAVLRSDPDWSQLPAETPREVLMLLRRCLEKDPRRRLRDLGDIALVLEDTTQTRQVTPPATARSEEKRKERPVEGRSLSARFGIGLSMASVILGLVIAGIALWRQPKSMARANQIRSLAVLPFNFETSDAKLAGLGKWIPAEIRSKLGSLQNLQVVNSPARIEHLVQQKKSEVEIASELGVDGLVLGELHGQGDLVKAYVWVVDGAMGRALGKQREIVSSTSTISEIPNQVALAIVDELKLQISAAQRSGLQEPETRNAEAFLAFQRGLDLHEQRQFEKALPELRLAYQLDRNFTRAWAYLGMAEWVPFVFGGSTNRVQDVFQRLSGEVDRFYSQRPADPALAQLRFSIAMLYERNWTKARNIYWEILHSQAPDPDLLFTMFWYYGLIEGHLDQALQTVEQAISIAPENFVYRIDQVHMLASFGRNQEALRAMRALPAERIQFEDFSDVLILNQDLVAAKENAKRVLALRPNVVTKCHLVLIHAMSGAPEEARKLLQELERDAALGVYTPFGFIAWNYGELGDFEAAKRWLRKGVQEGRGDWSMLMLRNTHPLQLFGKFPWYWELVDEMKFPPLQEDHPCFALEQAMRYGRGKVELTGGSTNDAPKTLAVLPFDKIGSGAADDDFNEGLTIELITLLQNVKGLQVQGPMAWMRFKGSTEWKQVGEQLKVDHLLLCKVSRSDDRLHINVILQKTDGFGLWATDYDRKLSDIFAIQTEVAQQVTEALKVKLGVEEKRCLARQATASPEAHALYLQGRAAWNRRTTSDLERAIGFFNQALEQDPNFALAYAGLADVHMVWPIYSDESPGRHPAESVKFARIASDKDPLLAEPHAALGYARALFQSDWEGAEKELQAAILLNPEYANAHHWYGDLLLILGRNEEALKEARRSVELDPTLANKVSCGVAMSRTGLREQGITYLEQLIGQDPSYALCYIWLSSVYVANGELEKATETLERAESASVQHDKSRLLLWKARLLALRGKTKEAREVLARVEKSGGSNALRALVVHSLGDDREALDLLENVVREGGALSDFLYHIPSWSKLHGDPRFRAILKALSLKKYFPVPRSITAQ